MTFSAFLYRRLARWVTCEFNLGEQSKISLQNKYEVASFRDVFCHPFYWQVFNWLDSPPKLILDCGAHCGHFSLLSNICLESKFGLAEAQYVLVEPNPYLLPVLKKNLTEAGLINRVNLKQGLLGGDSGVGKLWINPKNYLATGLHQSEGAEPHDVPYINLEQVLGNRPIDLMKLDIEGGEFELVRSSKAIFKNVNLLFMELHQASEEMHQELLDSLNSVGLHSVAQPVYANGQQLLILKRLSN
jgi:FkbM family methyltransferase